MLSKYLIYTIATHIHFGLGHLLRRDQEGIITMDTPTAETMGFGEPDGPSEEQKPGSMEQMGDKLGKKGDQASGAVKEMVGGREVWRNASDPSLSESNKIPTTLPKHNPNPTPQEQQYNDTMDSFGP
jgi:hypothetical protein